MELYTDGKVFTLEDYKKVTVYGSKESPFSSQLSNKGQKEELEAFGNAIQTESTGPIPLWQQFQATEISFQVEKLITSYSRFS